MISDDNLDKNTPPPSQADLSEKKPQSRKSLLGALNQDLKSALDNWDMVTEEVANKQSPEEQQLSEIQKLLGELKSKLSQFED